ncbi:MAG: 4Fe-4S binding protein [Clostridiales bacterium]|nr:4Fe-4S binding protein [Clostridiales bacterium]
MKRKIIHINQELCNGCGLCVDACHEGAIHMVDGKARLLRDDYCDGLGDCLPACPTEAITFETRVAAPFDKEAVAARMAQLKAEKKEPGEEPAGKDSRLQNFPVQLQLVAVNAPFFEGAHLLLAADCAAYAHGDFHRRFMQGKVTLIGCPKLDEANYALKLAEIIAKNDIRSLTLIRMQVPCCGGLQQAAEQALVVCGKTIPYEVITLSTTGEIVG